MAFYRTGLSLLTAVLSENTSGDRTVIAAVAGKKIAVYKWALTVAAPVSLVWKTGATAKTGAMPFGANGGEVRDESVSGEPWFQTAANEALVLSLSANVLVAGILYYALLD